MQEPLIRLQNISKSFDGSMVLDDLNLDIKENEFVTLLGPSGCGKTTTLRIIGGFEKPDSGKVFFDGEDITFLPPNKRHCFWSENQRQIKGLHPRQDPLRIEAGESGWF